MRKNGLFPLAFFFLLLSLSFAVFAATNSHNGTVEKNHVLYELINSTQRETTHYVVRSFYDSKEAAESITSLSVLSEIDGIPVTKIAINGKLLFGTTSYAAETIALPDSITSISKGAFQNMTKLKEIQIPEKVKRIRDYTFSGCTSLKKIALPNKLYSIGKCAFLDCKSLEKVNLPRSLTYVGSYAFTRTAIRKLTIPSRCMFENLSFSNCPKLETVCFNNRESLLLEDWMFFACQSLKTVVLPKTTDGITLNAYCFKDCTQLLKIKNADQIKTIGAKAFENCKSLSFFTVSTQITSIARLAFSGCDSLKKLRVLTTDQAFLRFSDFLKTLTERCKVYVKTEKMKQAFLAAGCKNRVIVKADLE